MPEAIFLITYDLKQPGRNYNSLFAAIRALGPGQYLRPLESVWILAITSPLWVNALGIRNELAQHIDMNDGLMVIEITGAQWASWLHPNSNAWMILHVR